MIPHPITFNAARVTDAYKDNDRRFAAPALVCDEQANTLISLAIDLLKFEVTSEFIHDLIGEAGAKGQSQSDQASRLDRADVTKILMDHAPRAMKRDIRTLSGRFDWKGVQGTRVHDSRIWDDVLVRQPRPRQPAPRPQRRDPFQLLGEAGRDAAYLLHINGDGTLQAVYRKDNADMECLPDIVPGLENLRCFNETDAQAAMPIGERVAAWNNIRFGFDAHAIKPIDATPQEFGKNSKMIVIARDGRILMAEEWTNENNTINTTTMNWRGTVVSRNTTIAGDANGPRIDMNKLEGHLEVRVEGAMKKANALLGFNIPASEVTGFIGAKPRLVRDGGAVVQLKAGDCGEKEALHAYTPYLAHGDEGVGVTWGTDGMNQTRIFFDGDLGDVFREKITVEAQGMTGEQKPKGDKRTASVPWYFIAVPEADDVTAGNKSLSELFALGSTKFDKAGNQTNGIALTKATLAEYGIDVSVVGVDDQTTGDQYARIQLPADWMSGQCKDYKIEVGVDDAVHGYSNVMHKATAGALDAKLKVSDQTWFHTAESHVMIRIRRGDDDLEVARFKINFDPQGDTPFLRDFVDMERYDQYEYMIRRGQDALTAFQKTRQISAKEMSVTGMMRAIRKDGYTFHAGTQGYKVTTREKAYAAGVAAGQYTQEQLDNVKAAVQQDKKTNNYFVVQVLNADGSAGAIIRDAQDAVDFDTQGYMALFMPNHAGTNANLKLYIGGSDFGAKVWNKDIPITVPEGATCEQKEAARAEVLEAANRPQMLWGGYSTPDKTRDGIGKKKGDDFAPQHLATMEELEHYIDKMKAAQGECHIHLPDPGQDDEQGIAA